MAFKCSLQPFGNDEHGEHLKKHGDGVKDVAFTVEDAAKIYNIATSRGAIGI